MAQEKLSRLYQRGSVSVYVEEFLNLVLSIPDMTERDKVHLFAKGLKRETRKEVLLRQCLTLDDAMKVADMMDAIYTEIRGWRRTSTGLDTQQANDTSTPMELGYVRKEFQGRCFTCNEWGHRASECVCVCVCVVVEVNDSVQKSKNEPMRTCVSLKEAISAFHL